MNSIRELLTEAQSHHHSGRLHDAQALYIEIIEQDPVHGDALNLLGTVLAQRGEVENAVTFLRRATRAEPDVPNYAC
ncbi:MAG: tetratricopeptide repeat protein, partial [Rhodospirillales bacterium]|nr:tetratricopeptide repeat protein [Rhodospirillales bacterium]